MENAINFSVTPLQVLLALAFQVWIVVFPIVIIRKLNAITDILLEHFQDNKESA